MNEQVVTFAIIALIFRVIGSIFFAWILVVQVKLRLSHYQDQLNRFRELLIGLTLIPFVFNFLAIYNNYVRIDMGKQSEVINNWSFLLGSITSTATAIILYLLYRRNAPKQ